MAGIDAARTQQPGFRADIAGAYDELLVPLIFEGYAQEMARRVAARKPRKMLETAAGSGALTRALAAVLDPDVAILSTDLSPEMQERAKARQGDDPRIRFEIADAQHLPFGDAAFDLLVCQFGVMLFPDRVAAHAEAKRVLEPGAPYLFCVWDTLESNFLPHVVDEACGALFPDDPPTFLRRFPHGYTDHDRIRADLAAGGFPDARIEAVTLRGSAPSARHLAVTYCRGTPMRQEFEARRPGELDAVTDELTALLEKRFGSGPIEGPLQTIIVETAA